MMFAILGSVAIAEETDERVWTAKMGSKVTARAVSFDGEIVALVTSAGKEIQLKIGKLSEPDQKFLRDHFQQGGADSDETVPVDLPIETGKTLGPIQADEDSSYFIYVPENLIPGGRAPILFVTWSGGSNINSVDNFKKAADLLGIALGASKESKNGKGRLPINAKHSKDCLSHIRETLPIDTKRTVFAGNSGGSVVAWRNAIYNPSVGCIPFNGYLPEEFKKPAKGRFFYVCGGAKDYNRYLSAYAAKTMSKESTHRFHPGGHVGSGPGPASDGLIWVYTRHLYDKRAEFPDEIRLIEGRLLKWLKQEFVENPHEAYYWTDHLLNTCEVTGSFRGQIEELHRTLSENANAVRYLEARKALVAFSAKQFADLGKDGGSKFEHTTSKIEKAASRLKEKYAGVPGLDAVLEDLGQPTKR